MHCGLFWFVVANPHSTLGLVPLGLTQDVELRSRIPPIKVFLLTDNGCRKCPTILPVPRPKNLSIPWAWAYALEKEAGVSFPPGVHV